MPTQSTRATRRCRSPYDHTIVVTEVDTDEHFKDGIDFDPNETQHPPPTRSDLLAGVEAEARLHISRRKFLTQYGKGDVPIEVVRGQADDGFKQRLAAERTHPQTRLYQAVPTKLDATNCQSFSSWLLTGTPQSADAAAVQVAIQDGVQSGEQQVRRVRRRFARAAPWDPFGVDRGEISLAGFIKIVGNGFSNFIIWVVQVLVIMLVFPLTMAGTSAMTYAQNRAMQLLQRVRPRAALPPAARPRDQGGDGHGEHDQGGPASDPDD